VVPHYFPYAVSTALIRRVRGVERDADLGTGGLALAVAHAREPSLNFLRSAGGVEPNATSVIDGNLPLSQTDRMPSAPSMCGSSAICAVVDERADGLAGQHFLIAWSGRCVSTSLKSPSTNCGPDDALDETGSSAWSVAIV
jgi:hypothetical protein